MLNEDFEFITPDHTISEIDKYEGEIIEKAKITREEFGVLMSIIFERIDVIPYEDYNYFFEESRLLISDVKDIPFIALCLALNADGIWSNDAHFLEQKRIKIFKTGDLTNMFRENERVININD